MAGRSGSIDNQYDFFGQELIDQGDGMGWLYMEMAVGDRCVGGDYDGPGGVAGAVLFHDFNNFVGLGIFGGMGHGGYSNPIPTGFCAAILPAAGPLISSY